MRRGHGEGAFTDAPFEQALADQAHPYWGTDAGRECPHGHLPIDGGRISCRCWEAGFRVDRRETPDLMKVLDGSKARRVIGYLEEKVTEPVDPAQAAGIAAYIAAVCGLDYGEAGDLFVELDERPGQFDSRYAGSGWHRRLRQARNDRANRFFEVLSGRAGR